MPGAINYDGHSVTESNWSQGTNSCWYNNAPFDHYPSVAGSTWTVGQSPAPHDGYGLDGIGFGSTGVAYIHAYAGQHGVSFPCELVFYQEMTYDTFFPYAYNIDSQTIGSNTVQVCRAGVCSPVIPY